MGTQGRHRVRKRGVKWTEEVEAWLRERCPAREHGYVCRKELLDELNATFGTDFSKNAFVTHCYNSGIQLGLSSNVPRGEKHWRHRPVGSLQQKKGYVRIKVAEPDKWMQYQRYVWEQNHPGESAEGKVVIFMDGNNRNFDSENLERVTRTELGVMAELGHTKDMTREEREVCLLRARIAIQMGKLLGKKKSGAFKQKLYYEKNKDTPEYKAKKKAYFKRHWQKIKADPARHAEFLRRQREYNKRRKEKGAE